MGTNSQDYQVQQALASSNEAKARISFAETIAQRDYEQALTDLYRWTRRYELAVQKNEHDLASKAKFQMERHEAIAGRLAKLAGEQMPQLNTIKQRLNFCKEQIRKLNSNSGRERQSDQEKLESQNVTEIQLQDKELKQEDLLKLSIQETKQAIQVATNKLVSMNKNYQKAQNEAIKLRQEAILALQTSTNNNDNALILEKLISKTTTNKYIDLIEAQIEQQTETIKLLKNNLATIESFKICFDNNITT
ncbi:hypothetical protein NIES4071_60360 [Calothrix sp. NIES-4071]|nr:hypothetical protein NIES4071_60360 [Calothrix sp. NIES-4071]BAZ60343.1 hypothetical protein NIES4105_60310 [Calothrix sp. NIES-4105]